MKQSEDTRITGVMNGVPMKRYALKTDDGTVFYGEWVVDEVKMLIGSLFLDGLEREVC